MEKFTGLVKEYGYWYPRRLWWFKRDIYGNIMWPGTKAREGIMHHALTAFEKTTLWITEEQLLLEVLQGKIKNDERRRTNEGDGPA